MKTESRIFIIATVFFALITPLYWVATAANDDLGGGDPTGTVALAMTGLLTMMIALYLAFHARRMDPRPEDRLEADIADGAGELGFFPPYSWWPLWCGATLAICVLGVGSQQWWLFIIGVALGAVALCGWVFEYYRGEHAH